MRSGLSAALMGIGGIFLAFGATILIISIFTRTSPQWHLSFPTEMTTGWGSVIAGGVMFVLGWLLHRTGRRVEA